MAAEKRLEGGGEFRGKPRVRAREELFLSGPCRVEPKSEMRDSTRRIHVEVGRTSWWARGEHKAAASVSLPLGSWLPPLPTLVLHSSLHSSLDERSSLRGGRQATSGVGRARVTTQTHPPPAAKALHVRTDRLEGDGQVSWSTRRQQSASLCFGCVARLSRARGASDHHPPVHTRTTGEAERTRTRTQTWTAISGQWRAETARDGEGALLTKRRTVANGNSPTHRLRLAAGWRAGADEMTLDGGAACSHRDAVVSGNEESEASVGQLSVAPAPPPLLPVVALCSNAPACCLRLAGSPADVCPVAGLSAVAVQVGRERAQQPLTPPCRPALLTRQLACSVAFHTTHGAIAAPPPTRHSNCRRLITNRWHHCPLQPRSLPF